MNGAMVIKEGRHPLVQEATQEKFVPVRRSAGKHKCTRLSETKQIR